MRDGILGHSCLPFSEAGRDIFIRWGWCDRDKYATIESERSLKVKVKKKEGVCEVSLAGDRAAR